MTTDFHKFKKIEQLRSVVHHVNTTCKFHGIEVRPTIEFVGTVKIHGTNAGVGYDPRTGAIWAQARSRVITPEMDNAGFAQFVDQHRATFVKFFEANIGNRKENHFVFGEFFGPGIQKSVGVNQIPTKRFASFEFGYKDIANEYIRCETYDTSESFDVVANINRIEDFGIYKCVINFENPAITQNKLIEMTESVEAECPVARAFGVKNGTGEGIVWKAIWKYDKNDVSFSYELCFKVKGEKHSISKVKTLAAVDIEKLNSIAEFVEYAVTDVRLEQGLTEVFGIGGELDIKKMGDYIRWVNNDVYEEESDVVFENGLERKDYAHALSTKARQYFMAQLST